MSKSKKKMMMKRESENNEASEVDTEIRIGWELIVPQTTIRTEDEHARNHSHAIQHHRA